MADMTPWDDFDIGVSSYPNLSSTRFTPWPAEATDTSGTPGTLPPPTPQPEAPTAPETPSEPDLTDAQKNLLQRLAGILSQAGFDNQTVDSFINEIIKPSLLQGLNEFDILRLIRDSAAHKAKFPEYHERIANGFMAWDEATILAFHDNAKQLGMQILGRPIDDSLISMAAANNVSLSEWEHKLVVRKRVEDMGGPIADFFAARLGIKLDDKSLQQFLDPEISTPELDSAYQEAFFSEYGRQIGLKQSATPEQIEELKRRGVSVDAVMQNYERMRQVLPAIDRLAGIDEGVRADQGNPFDSWASAFEAYQYLDPTAQMEIARLFSNETARFTTGGGIAAQGGQVAGLLSKAERDSY